MGVAARVADDDDVVVVVAGRVDRRGDADVDGAAGNIIVSMPRERSAKSK